MSNFSESTNSSMSPCVAARICKCGVSPKLNTSWTQLNPGRRFFACKIGKKKGGCDYFCWYDDEMPTQAKNIIWGLLKRVKAFEEEKVRAKRRRILLTIVVVLLVVLWKLYD
uniref:GRF-type domain-containing protein n=3 Tax=Nicotiana TaxID=4085 RepID=A0A1S4C904_TOBAC|nr:PREDICTED: uncharacterized protein LOC104223528 [Nicotiana sylvestris]XP_016458180.1 PREDICTED: uncharacterized protein LOC107781879 [Nicotiana tabacum]XP_016497613.1 PREDICTED: uncharacterized protein LOC107816407 [Nicotiana tabacum]XP_016505081.1 PREDICTED: uncharacterized protein LOC107823013 [Nicotiana tabacum]